VRTELVWRLERSGVSAPGVGLGEGADASLSETIRQFLYFYAKRVRTCLRLGDDDGFLVGAFVGAVR
jgi:hypothetical protein